MTWLWVILIAAAIGGIIGFISSGNRKGAAQGAASAGLGCRYIILNIFHFYSWNIYLISYW
ncbi:MAG: hypothetical protein ACOH2V_06805 [Candidatus Saccharimonadaceae bacterium]